MKNNLTSSKKIQILKQMKEDKVLDYEKIYKKIQEEEKNLFLFTDTAENIVYKLGDYRTKINNFNNTTNEKVYVVVTDKEALEKFFSGTEIKYFPIIIKSEKGKIISANYWDEI